MKVALSFGAFAPRIALQLHDQDVTADAVEIDQAQKDADAVNRLRVRGTITPAQAEAANKRILKRLLKAATSSPTEQEGS